jgi:hypothetical protein
VGKLLWLAIINIEDKRARERLERGRQTDKRSEVTGSPSSSRTAGRGSELRGQGDVDHVRKLRLGPQTHLQASDLRLFLPWYGEVSKAAGHGHTG